MSLHQIQDALSLLGVSVEPLAPLMQNSNYGDIVAHSIALWECALVLEDSHNGEVVFRGSWMYINKSTATWRDEVTTFIVNGEPSTNKPDMQKLLSHLFPNKAMIRDLTLKVNMRNFPSFVMPPLATTDRIFWFENKGQVDMWLSTSSNVQFAASPQKSLDDVRLTLVMRINQLDHQLNLSFQLDQQSISG